jgi:hypothetical protein
MNRVHANQIGTPVLLRHAARMQPFLDDRCRQPRALERAFARV